MNYKAKNPVFFNAIHGLSYPFLFYNQVVSKTSHSSKTSILLLCFASFLHCEKGMNQANGSKFFLMVMFIMLSKMVLTKYVDEIPSMTFSSNSY